MKNRIFNWLEQICCSGEDTKRKMIDIIFKHEMWLKINRKKLLDPESQFSGNELRADFSALKTIDNLWIRNADLRYANFGRMHLKDAVFDGCDLYGADFFECDLESSAFACSSLRKANLCGANLSRGLFYGADFADVKTDSYTNFEYADLAAAINTSCLNIPLRCPEKGAFIGWKGCYGKRNGLIEDLVIVKLYIPEDAKRSSATSAKCRCDKAVVLDIQDLNGNPVFYDVTATSLFREQQIYYVVGETVKPVGGAFDINRFAECSAGIHFFYKREDAVTYVKGEM